MFYEQGLSTLFVITALLVVGIIVSVFALFGIHQFKEEEKARLRREKLNQERKDISNNLDKVAYNKKMGNSKKGEYVKTTSTSSNTANKGTSTMEIELRNKEIALKKREEELNDKEMALAEGLEEILALKEKVDAIIKAQQAELFSYCSVSEESALKMKEVTLEIQKMLDETVRKIQE